ncbi:MAG: GNAT family N-acetyltransferase [Paracoccaceae bacterium]
MADIPMLETERLILRGMRRDDFADFARLWADPAVTRFILPEPRDETASWRSFLLNAGSWAVDGFGQWAITLKGTGDYVGQAGFFDARRGLGADFDGFPECGWVIDPAQQGQGVGAEACAAAHGWFDAEGKGASRVMITVGHVASERLATRLGYRQFRVTCLDGADLGLMGREGVTGNGA